MQTNQYYGIGAAAIGTSFTIGEYYSYGGGNLAGVGFSTVENGFIIEDYVPTIQPGIGTATIGGVGGGPPFIVGYYTNQPVQDVTDPYQYRTHKSSVLLGNCQSGRKSKRYFSYHTYELEGSSTIIG